MFARNIKTVYADIPIVAAFTSSPMTSLMPLFLILFLSGCGGGSGGDTSGDTDNGSDGDTSGSTDGGSDADTSGDTDGGEIAVFCPTVKTIDLSQSFFTTRSCARLGLTQEGVASCIETELTEVFEPACLANIDVFVPGTASEDGGWKQFNSMFSNDTGRGYISLKYGEASAFDAAGYDQSVENGAQSLEQLLYALNTRFNTSDGKPNVRVFGHSKGAHVTSLVSEKNEFSNMEFYAFAQPGRTAKDTGNTQASTMGTPGEIEKLSSNLVGINWKNDEVQYYTGSGSNGLQMPEKWSYPGYINQDTHNGANPLSFRIDHHNNYGGSYTDGLSSNEPANGEGSVKDGYPYCATGDSFFGGEDECEKSNFTYHPYFWESEDCREKAYEMMQNAAVGSQHYIGFSGPRIANCKEDISPIRANYRLEYKHNIGEFFDDVCELDVEILFGGFGNRADGGSISFSTKDASLSGWKTRTGVVNIVPHMTLRVTANLDDLDKWGQNCNAVAKTEAYIRKLEVTFNHPRTDQSITRTIIGLGEGSTAFPFPTAELSGQNNVGWSEQNSSDKFNLYYAIAPYSSLMIKGDTADGARGRFYKWVYLID